ncbi:MAG: hypothetical protein HC892_03315 [Saprospiraceae bacterium]|nr:hypothetical protein [Saprospiraceae bacterium]
MFKQSILLLVVLVLAACASPKNEENTTQDFTVNTAVDETLNFEQLRLYPVEADVDFIESQAGLANWITLEAALEKSRFRIVEKRPFGRFEDTNATNALMVENKTQDTVFLMAGDVVEGGNQDRMIAENRTIAPNSIKTIKVFCVERGRWNPRTTAEAGDAQRSIAFSGYYHVASSDLRRTMKATNNQQEVWKKVSEITTHHQATSDTDTYGALAASEAFNKLSKEYLDFFEGKMVSRSNVVGIVAVSGNRILGIDVFGHPNLFRAKYASLLHGYVTEAVTNGSAVNIQPEQLSSYLTQFYSLYHTKDEAKRFMYQNKMVHFTNLDF